MSGGAGRKRWRAELAYDRENEIPWACRRARDRRAGRRDAKPRGALVMQSSGCRDGG
jgi:hypothetical protein